MCEVISCHRSLLSVPDKMPEEEDGLKEQKGEDSDDPFLEKGILLKCKQ